MKKISPLRSLRLCGELSSQLIVYHVELNGRSNNCKLFLQIGIALIFFKDL